VNRGLSEEFQVLTVQHEGTEERILSSIEASKQREQSQPGPKGQLHFSVMSIQSDYIK